MPVAIFCIAGNQYQTESKRSETFVDFFGPEDIQWAKVPKWEPEVSTRHQGVPGGPGAPWWVVPTLVASRTLSLPYKFPNNLEILVETL